MNSTKRSMGNNQHSVDVYVKDLTIFLLSDQKLSNSIKINRYCLLVPG